MKKRRYIHPEKLFGVGCTGRDKVVNYLCDISKKTTKENLSEMEKLTSSLSKKDQVFLKDEVESSNANSEESGGYELKESESYKLKQISDIKECYPDGKIPVYKISNGFYECVKKLDRALPSNFLDTGSRPMYLHLPSNASNFEGAYVDAVMEKEFIEEKDVDAFCLRVVFCHKDFSIFKNEIFIFFFTGKSLNFDSLKRVPVEKNFSSSEFREDIQRSTNDFYMGNKHLSTRKEMLLGVLNSLIYIKSKDPEIEKLRPVKLYSNKEFAKLESSKQESLCTIPVNLVGWSYYGKLYTKGSTMVAPHFRWQPCGEGRRNVKLIMVKEHERKYNKAVESVS